MKNCPLTFCFAAIVAMLLAPPHPALAAEQGRCSFWIDAYRGEPLGYEEVLDDLAHAGIVYLGEAHTLAAHHAVQERILTDLAKRGKALALGMEQLESPQQPAVDRYNRGEISFEQLAEAINWPRSWNNYRQYRPVVEAARKLKIPVVALNAPAATIHQVRLAGGIDRLDAKTRGQLPKEIVTDDLPYTKLLNMQLMVHMAADASALRPWVEAQIARDEAMAATLHGFLSSPAGRGRSAVVICGNGHIAYGLGTPARVRRRMPQTSDRIVLMSAAGEDLKPSPGDAKAARPIEITHEQLRHIDRPIADYLWVLDPKKAD